MIQVFIKQHKIYGKFKLALQNGRQLIILLIVVIRNSANVGFFWANPGGGGVQTNLYHYNFKVHYHFQYTAIKIFFIFTIKIKKNNY